MRALLHLSVKLPQYIPHPVNDWVLTQNIMPKDIILPNGIYLPQDEVREDLAAVIAVGPGWLCPSGGYHPIPLKPGDIVRTTRKKGRTAYLDCMGEGGIGDRQTSYNYYQGSEIIAVEYHSEWLAREIAKISNSFPITVSLMEEEEYRLKAAEEAKQKYLKEEGTLQEKDALTKKKREFRERLRREVTGQTEE